MLYTRFFLLVLTSFLLAFPLLAQEQPARDSLEQEILAHPVTDVVLLGKTRAVLLESLKAGDYAKARKVVEYMAARFDTARIIVLFTSEKLLVSYWLSDFSTIFSFARRVEFDEDQLDRKIPPASDLFYDELIELSRREEGRLRANIGHANLAPHERDFLSLLLTDMLGQDRGDELQRKAHQEELNAEADAFLASYTTSDYYPFVRNYIRFVVVRSDWGYGYGLSLGYLGLPFKLSRNLKDYALLSMVLEGAYRQAYTCISLDLGLAHDIVREFDYNGTWKEGLSVMHTSVMLAAGPMLTLGGNFSAIPTLGIGSMDFSPPEEEKDKTGNDVSLSFPAWALGVNFRIPLGGEEGTTFITFNAGYRNAVTSIDLARGGYTFVNVGVNWFTRPEHRDF